MSVFKKLHEVKVGDTYVVSIWNNIESKVSTVGKVNITTNDLTSIQGSFSFDAVNNTGKIVKITDGKFVVKK